MMREIQALRRAALVAILLMGGMFAVGRASADGDREARHERLVTRVCAHPMHWEREHGVTILIEGCG